MSSCPTPHRSQVKDFATVKTVLSSGFSRFFLVSFPPEGGTTNANLMALAQRLHQGSFSDNLHWHGNLQILPEPFDTFQPLAILNR